MWYMNDTSNMSNTCSRSVDRCNGCICDTLRRLENGDEVKVYLSGSDTLW